MKTLWTAMGSAFLLILSAYEAFSLTVENINAERMTHESQMIVYGNVLTHYSQWEGKNIYTYTTVQIKESLKGETENRVIVKQLGGHVGDMGQEISGSPLLANGEDVLLFLTKWQGSYWIHSIVLGKFSVVREDGNLVAYNDLNNIGLIDPTTRREITDPNKKVNHFLLQQFLSQIRSYSEK